MWVPFHTCCEEISVHCAPLSFYQNKKKMQTYLTAKSPVIQPSLFLVRTMERSPTYVEQSRHYWVQWFDYLPQWINLAAKRDRLVALSPKRKTSLHSAIHFLGHLAPFLLNFALQPQKLKLEHKVSYRQANFHLGVNEENASDGVAKNILG